MDKEYSEDLENVVNEEISEYVEYTEEDLKDALSEDEDLLDPEDVEYDTHEEILSEMEGDKLEDISEDICRDTIYDSTGKPVDFVVEGDIVIEKVKLDDILLPPRTRKALLNDTEDLESLIIQWGLIEPLHVIPFNGKYLLVHGFRRYQALKNLGYEDVLCMVDTTRPKTTVRFLEVLCNNSKNFNFFEMMDFGEFVERKQNTFQNDTIEKIVGMDAGDYLKAKYIRQFDSFGVTGEVLTGKKTIKEGFKRLEKELDKLEKEKIELQSLEFDEQGLPISYTEAIEEVSNVQDVKDRKPLPHYVYGRIKTRDNYTCQTCGIGFNQPELNAIHEVHHIIPVKQKGSDDDDNLILICSNCHKVVGAYIEGSFKVPEDSENMYSNMIILGNIAKKGMPEGKTAYGLYMENCEQPWLEE